MKLRRLLYLLGFLLMLLTVFIIDLIRKNVELEIAGIPILREVLLIGAFVLLYVYLEERKVHQSLTPIKRVGMAMIYSVFAVLFCLIVATAIEDNFDVKGNRLIPLTYWQVFVGSLVGVALGVCGLLLFRLVRGLVLFKPKRETRRNYSVYVGLVLATSASVVHLDALESSVLSSVLVGFALLFAVVNSFRLPWIVYLTKREKIFALIYSFVLVLALVGLNIMSGSERTLIGKSLLYHSYPVSRFVVLTLLFCNIYFGMAFISTLFHLPTAEAFERKTTEVTSLHNLGKLVTQVFDFNQLVDTVTTMTLQVCEAKSCWLEIIHPVEPRDTPESRSGRAASRTARGDYVIQLVGTKNISGEEIEKLLPRGEKTLRDEVIATRAPIVVDDLARDPRFAHMRLGVGSLVVVPLVSHAGMLGILYATKDAPFGFFRDDVDVISAFADQATIAIENSRLIKKSIERERLLREMTLAQEIQRKLLPQALPKVPTVELDAASIPAFEVGGDYYDVAELGNGNVGIIVGDVSGKGISAAFYMSEMKGIFQSLSRLYPSPRDFMLRANIALSGSIDKHSFVTLIYGVLDVTTGKLTLARAGHCPMLHVSGTNLRYIRPGGMGLGLATGKPFESSMEEYSTRLQPGDICVFYTDGVTETRNGEDEFGYERLMETVLSARHLSAAELKNVILDSVKTYADKPEYDDDITVVVVKWLGGTQHV